MAAAASASAALPLPLPLPMPGYVELLRRGWGSVSGAWRGCPECGWALARRTWEENARPASQEALLALLAALGWTLARKAAARNLLTPRILE
ncbi:hypothetical protein JD844_034012 [Phrynosoma platyrhinos]|uniref:Uncharacterized protein n=1 Tax=Phrynosoma platyrhinos TaxID=52577 RepID=A0ABQ7T844_PHRPL|nr:hypothetical protein JD844_034012 [Phrynosoma platyrhinos]